MLAQRVSKRDHESLAGLASHEADLIARQIELRPGQGSDVREALTGVEPELDQACPFAIGDSEDGAKLIN